jgi:hypothetical protein
MKKFDEFKKAVREYIDNIEEAYGACDCEDVEMVVSVISVNLVS